MDDANNRPYEYQPLQGDAKIRLLNIEPGSGDEKVRASLIPAAFDEEDGCVTPQPADPIAPDAGRRKIGHRRARRWRVLEYILHLWLVRWFSSMYGWIFRSQVEPPKDAPKPPSRQVLKYDAVSWAWGIRSKNSEIEILDDDRERFTFKVSTKLDQALRAVRSPNSVRTIWIDAVCINQGNDFEKSHQVPMMDRIYGLADKVCVWLGPVSDTHDAGTAFELLNKLLHDMDYRKTVEGVRPAQLEALSGMMRRDWFSRRWIIQEIALAKRAVVFCDRFSMEWVRFAQAIELFIEGESRMKLADNATLRHRSIPHYWKNVSALGAARLVREISAIRRMAPNTGFQRKHDLLMSLEEIVCRLETFRTSKPHDTIYAYLALAKDASPVAHLDEEGRFSQKLLQVTKAFDMTKMSAKAFFVDYKRPYAEICCQFIKFAISQQARRTRALDIICRPWAYEEEDHVARKKMRLPKWVATIAASPFEMTTQESTLGLYRRNGDPFVGPPLKPVYNAADSAPVRDKTLKFVSYEPKGDQPAVHSLIVTGFILDEVQTIKDKVTPDALVPEEWLTLGKWMDPRQPPPDELWRTLVGDRGPNGTSCPLSYPLCLEEALRLSQSGRNLETSAITSHPDKYESFIAGFCSRVQEVVVNRRLIRTTRHSRLGLVSGREDLHTGNPARASSIRRGDLICILHGCSVPVVLRKVRKSAGQMEFEKEQQERFAAQAARRVAKKWRMVLERRRARRWFRPRVVKYWRRTRRVQIAMEWMVVGAIICWLAYPYTPWAIVFGTVKPVLLPLWVALRWKPWLYIFRIGRDVSTSLLQHVASIKLPNLCADTEAAEQSVLKEMDDVMCPVLPGFAQPAVFNLPPSPVDFPQCLISEVILVKPTHAVNTLAANKFVSEACRLKSSMTESITTGAIYVRNLLSPLLEAVVSPFGVFLECCRHSFAEVLKIYHEAWVWILGLEVRLNGVKMDLDPSRYDWRVRVAVGAFVLIILLKRVRKPARRAWKQLRRRRAENNNWATTATYERDYYYEFWGECYIDGMMDGYAVKVQNEVMHGKDKKAKERMANRIFELR